MSTPFFARRAAADAIKFTVDQQALSKKKALQSSSASASISLSAAASAKLPPGAITPNITSAASTLPSTSNTPAVSNGGVAAVNAAAERRAQTIAQLEREQQLAAMVCSLENKDACLMCGS